MWTALLASPRHFEVNAFNVVVQQVGVHLLSTQSHKALLALHQTYMVWLGGSHKPLFIHAFLASQSTDVSRVDHTVPPRNVMHTGEAPVCGHI